MKSASIAALILVFGVPHPPSIQAAHAGKFPDRALAFSGPGTSDHRNQASNRAKVRADTTWYGSYQVIGDQYYAIPGVTKAEVMWTFDRGDGPFDVQPPLVENAEGWSAHDLSNTGELYAPQDNYFRVIDDTLDLDGDVPPPIISGIQSLWVGIDRPTAEDFCYLCGAGYGDSWCQRVSSEPIDYDGTGDVILSFSYWAFSEECFDGTQVYLRRQDSTELLLNPYEPGMCPDNLFYAGGTFTGAIGRHNIPETYSRTVTQEEIGVAQEIRFIIEFSSDFLYSDQDCQFPTLFGPFGADDMTIEGEGIEDRFYNFEDGLQGWTPDRCMAIGDFAGIADIGDYTILDPCACSLDGNVLELHAGTGELGVHPAGQHVVLLSPIVDIAENQGTGFHTIFMEYDLYAEMPLENGVFIRPGWIYYPYICEVSGDPIWSPRVGQYGYRYYGSDPECFTVRSGGTEMDLLGGGLPIPPNAEQVAAMIEVWADCEAWGIDPCSGVTNKTPLIDNIVIGVTDGIAAPSAAVFIGCELQDVGSYPSDLFDPRAAGPANATYDVNLDTPPGDSPDLCLDLLYVWGPLTGGDPSLRWEMRLWLRVAQRAPFQEDIVDGVATRYKIWRDRVSDGREIDRPDRPQFTSAWMDTVLYSSGGLYNNRYISQFREDDDDFVGEGLADNEILWDDVFYPGTRIEYFVTTNFVTTPNQCYYLPDTTGGYFYEFEILPGLRTAHVPNCGGAGFDYCAYQPAVLYIDASYDGQSQPFIENALRTVLNGLELCLDPAGCKIPRDRNWDRYDYGYPTGTFNVPFARGCVSGSNNGMTLNQILGYRAILLNTGSCGRDAMQDEDFQLFSQWLVSPDCEANLNRQVFIMNGDKTGELLEQPGGVEIEGHGAAFLTDVLGATLLCEDFNGVTDDPDCGVVNESNCVRWLPAGGPFGTQVDIDAFGSYCPNRFGFNVFSLNGGTGNRFYSSEDEMKDMVFAQVVNEDLGADANYRTILDGGSWDHRTIRDGNAGEPDGYCPSDFPSIITAAAVEIESALLWGFDVAENAQIPKLTNVEVLAGCQGTWTLPSEVGEIATTLPVNRLYASRPNPSIDTATIRFSLAQRRRVQIVVYDVGGKVVRRLLDEVRDAGVHSIDWNGLDNHGLPVAAGIYWSQMITESFRSNKKMVLLR